MEAPLEIRAWTLFYSLVKAFQSLWEGVVTIVHAFFLSFFITHFSRLLHLATGTIHRQALDANFFRDGWKINSIFRKDRDKTLSSLHLDKKPNKW